jgi:hypothetical protein
MFDEQQRQIKHLSDRLSSITNDWNDYWSTYSSFNTWQFWVLLAMLCVPLVILVFTIDKKNIFRYGFYGFIIHVFAIYSDLYGTTHSMWTYPYKVFPFPPSSFGLDASLIPVAYMMVYQWTTIRKKNYYLYIVLVAIAFSFVLKPLLSATGFFLLLESSYVELFMFYLFGGLVGKWLTNLFYFAQKKSDNNATT